MQEPLPKSKISQILRTVPYSEGFHFFTSNGNYTGETATSLMTFEKKLEVIAPAAVDFHFKRRDFQKWIADSIGDPELAHRIDMIKENLAGEQLRREILTILHSRIKELLDSL